MSTSLIRCEEWAPHPSAATRNRADSSSGRYESISNGTHSCCGGWQFVYAGVTPGRRYRIKWSADCRDVGEAADTLVGHVYWGEVATAVYATGTEIIWDYVSAEMDGSVAYFSADLLAPEGATHLTARCTLRWTPQGQVSWSVPDVEDLGVHEQPSSVRVATVTGTEAACAQPRTDVASCVDYYAELAERACQQEGAQLIALPEICLQWKLPGHAYDHAVAVPGPQTDRFARIASDHGAVIVVGLHERVQDAVYNSAVVIDSNGQMSGTYRKVHLASTEAISGIMPGDRFPVMETTAGRIGCTICMDSSASESARMIGLHGADFLVLPIMGDHRASLWHPGSPQLDEDRWQCIQRTRALDNQLCMVIARNMGRGSCIIDRSGDVLAYNDGSQDFVVADVEMEDGFRKWNGGCFRQVNWRQRRPHLYSASTDPAPEALQRLHAESPVTT
jgi:predicted amidohydrolase